MTKIEAGDTFKQKVYFSQEDVSRFAALTGDDNPIHLDPEYAASTIFHRPIVHGFLVGAVFSSVFGNKWPGHGTIYLCQDMTFKAPVYPEYNYEASFEVMETDKAKHRATIKCIIIDAAGNEVIEGIAKLMHKERF